MLCICIGILVFGNNLYFAKYKISISKCGSMEDGYSLIAPKI